jgi:hypothetical protein
MATKKPKPKIGRPPTERGAYNPNPCRQLGRISTEDWQQIQQAARESGQTFTGWAVGCLLAAAKRKRGITSCNDDAD